MSHGRYILDAAGNPVECEDVLEWGRWYEESRNIRHVGDDTINGIRVSTVFLALDHAYGNGPPILFETMMFRADGGDDLDYQERYATRAEAIEGHRRACADATARGAV